MFRHTAESLLDRTEAILLQEGFCQGVYVGDGVDREHAREEDPTDVFEDGESHCGTYYCLMGALAHAAGIPMGDVAHVNHHNRNRMLKRKYPTMHEAYTALNEAAEGHDLSIPAQMYAKHRGPAEAVSEFADSRDEVIELVRAARARCEATVAA